MDTVLIAEDNPVLRKLIRTRLNEYKNRFDPVIVKDGLDAIRVLKKQPVSLLVTDLKMPKIDGLTLLAYVDQHHPKTPCIIMTAHSTPKLKKRLQQDVVQYIEKPLKIEKLVQAVIEVLEQGIPTGTLHGVSIASFLQMIEMDQKTCLFEIDSPEKSKGLFYFQEGILFDAVYGKLRGVEAAVKMIQLDNLGINFRKLPQKSMKRRITMELMGLIMEAMRQKDESEGEPHQAETVFADSLWEQNNEDLQTYESGREVRFTNENIDQLRAIKGYKGVVILSRAGNQLDSDSPDDAIDFDRLQEALAALFTAAGDICEQSAIGPYKEIFTIASQGLVVCLCSEVRPDISLSIAAVFETGSNRVLIKIALYKILESIMKANY
jgi:CheY-like chemotaxis protein